jgi:hypothetical protein
MPHTEIHCGTAGTDTGEKTIKIYTGSVMDYAVAFRPHAMAAFGCTQAQIEQFERDFSRSRKKLVKKLQRLGVPYTYHEPHAENL